MKTKAVVTGGAGFIGSHVVQKLQTGYDVTVYDNLSTGKMSNLANLNVKFVDGDICDQEELSSACEGARAVFHLAAKISVAESMQDPIGTVAINTIGTLNVLAAAARCGVKTVVFSSSAAIYGDNPASPKLESMIPEPKSPYAVSKLDGEFYLRMFREQHGIQTISLRYFNVFGPRQDPDSPYAAAIPSFVELALAGQDLTIFGDGEQTRDFVYVDDVAQANLLAAEASLSGGAGERGEAHVYPDVFNVARGGSITIKKLAELIIRMAGSRSNIVYNSPREGDVKHSLADVGRIQKILGYKSEADLEAGLERTVAYFKELLEGSSS